MFPHLFQHWMTAKSARTFRPTVFLHPLFIMVVWVPCVLLGVWAAGLLDGAAIIPPKIAETPNSVLAFMVKKLTNPFLAGFLTVGILAAIMSSLDSQFLCIGKLCDSIKDRSIAYTAIMDASFCSSTRRM